MRHLLPVFALIMLLAACGKTPGYVISEGKMAEIMADIHTGEAVVDANGSIYRTDSAKQLFLQSICMRHGVTTEQLDTSLYWYGNHLEAYIKVYDKTVSILEDRIADAEKAGGKNSERLNTISLDGDSVNLWNGPTVVRSTSNLPSEFLTFNFSTDKNWERGDRYTVSARPINPRSPLFMTIAVAYNDGTAEYVTLNQGSEGKKTLTLVLDSAKVATSVYGSIHFTPSREAVSYLDSISVVRTRGKNNNVAARSGQQTVKLR